MGLRCLLGHDFTEPEIERERKEEGAEVVTTVREVKTCARCGETRIVSENTEVTTIEQLTDQATTAEATDGTVGAADAPGYGGDSTATGPSSGGGPFSGVDPSSAVDGSRADAGSAPDVGNAPGGSTVGTGLPDEDSVDDDAVILDDEPEPEAPASPTDPPTDRTDDPTGTRSTDPSAGPDAVRDGVDDEDVELIDEGPHADDTMDRVDEDELGGPTAADEDPDDGVILDDEGAPADGDGRAHGAWPSDDEPPEERSEPTPWPDQHGADEGYSAEITDDDDADAGVEFGGLTPERTEPSPTTESGTEYVEAPDDGVTDASPGDSSSGMTHGESPDVERLSSSVPTEYHCPECGLTAGTDGSSMRAGDICPECKRGYIDERPR